jgi:hypothetical protein
LEEACGISGDGGLRRSDRELGSSDDGRGPGMGGGGASSGIGVEVPQRAVKED